MTSGTPRLTERIARYLRKLRTRFGKRKVGADKAERWSRKDKITISLAVTGFVVSLFSFFYNVVWQLDDIRVVVGPSPNAFLSDIGEVTLSGSQTLTFINSGNRAAAITSVAGFATPLRSDRDLSWPCSPFGVILPIKSKQSVLKPGDIVVDTFPLAASPLALGWRQVGDGKMALGTETASPKPGDEFLVCLILEVVTPDSIVQAWRRPIYKVTLELDAGKLEMDRLYNAVPLFEQGVPIPVTQNTSYVFARLFRATSVPPSPKEMIERDRTLRSRLSWKSSDNEVWTEVDDGEDGGGAASP